MKYAAFCIIMLLGTLIVSDVSADESDGQIWLNTTYTGRLSGRWMGWAEVQARFGEDASRLSQFLIRPGLGYELDEGLVAWAGYARIETHNPSSHVGEHRAWQQLSWAAGEILGGSFSTRTRLEQRFVENGSDTGWRFRQFLRYERPFQSGGDTRFVATSETFVALNGTDWSARRGFDQARNFLGIGFTVFDNARLEIGYMNQFIDRPGPHDRINHIFPINLFGSF